MPENDVRELTLVLIFYPPKGGGKDVKNYTDLDTWIFYKSLSNQRRHGLKYKWIFLKSSLALNELQWARSSTLMAVLCPNRKASSFICLLLFEINKNIGPSLSLVIFWIFPLIISSNFKCTAFFTIVFHCNLVTAMDSWSPVSNKTLQLYNCQPILKCIPGSRLFL